MNDNARCSRWLSIEIKQKTEQKFDWQEKKNPKTQVFSNWDNRLQAGWLEETVLTRQVGFITYGLDSRKQDG